MGQVRHGSATTTHAVPPAIQRLQASLATLTELEVNSKTVAKWCQRTIGPLFSNRSASLLIAPLVMANFRANPCDTAFDTMRMRKPVWAERSEVGSIGFIALVSMETGWRKFPY